jgi:hypothetical protein
VRPRSLAAALGAVALVLPFALACSGDGTDASEPEATTTTAPLPVFPHTGVAAAGADTGGNHPAVVVKIDDGINSRPQTGLERADVVFEEEVEGVTRLASVFHSDLPDVVGNVRSARSSDVDIVAPLSKPVFAWSGGNAIVTAQILEAQRDGVLTDASYDIATDAYFRDPARDAPYDLYVRPGSLLELRAPEGQGAPAPIFTYRTGSTALPVTAVPSAGVTIGFTRFTEVSYAWDPERRAWSRFQVDGQHPLADSAFLAADGTQIAPENVVVLRTPYGVSAADRNSPQAYTVGEGEALVFTDGHLITGRWTRPDAATPVQLIDATGAAIALTPGRTWVELPRDTAAVTPLDQVGADRFVAVRR